MQGYAGTPVNVNELMPDFGIDLGVAGNPAAWWLGVPLQVGDDVIGLVAVQSYDAASAYSAADGSVQNGPATRPLKEFPVTVQGGEVVEA